MGSRFVQVALDVPVGSLFDYVAEDATHTDIGRRVIVPFNGRPRAGILLAVTERTDVAPHKLKPVTRIVREEAPLPPDILRLARFCSDYYHHPLGQVLALCLPPLLRRPKLKAERAPLAYRITDAGKRISASALPARARVGRRLLDRLQAGEAVLPAGGGRAHERRVLAAFVASGWVAAQPFEPLAAAAGPSDVLAPALNAAQAEALALIDAQRAQGFQVTLLHGITGSSKTEIYLRAAQSVIADGGQVLVLVPEINLTPQLEHTFRQRLPGIRVSSVHSGLSSRARADAWAQAGQGEASLVLGTRLAVFAPLPRLKLVVVDEEHDASYKQQEGLRYSARDLAVLRAHERACPVVLGSATPSLESFHHAATGRYRTVRLPVRAVPGAGLPAVKSLPPPPSAREALSAPLLEAIGERLSRGEQSLLFINRRGYAPALYCAGCGYLAACPRCGGAKLVYHLRDKRLRCHHCGLSAPPPAACPQCGNLDLKLVGHGTQRIEESLGEHFPAARILRIDRDSTRGRQTFEEMAARVRAGDVDLLVGTQMLVKGHDFPRLTLVGVLNADSALYSADFRASERLFAQLMQVAGRAGRGELPGEVLIQTAFPDHPVYRALAHQDYGAFAQTLLAERKALGFPPFVAQAMLRAEAPAIREALAFLTACAEAGRARELPITLYDPVPAQLTRVNGRDRAQLLIQARSRKALQQFLTGWVTHLAALPAGDVRWHLDVDPIEF